MKPTISIIILVTVTILGNSLADDNGSNDIDANESSNLIKSLLQKIKIFQDQDIEELKRKVIPVELHFFVQMVKYDKNLVQTRKNLLYNLRVTGNEAINCHENLHKKLNQLIHKTARYFEHSARMKLDEIVNIFKALIKELIALKQNIDHERLRNIKDIIEENIGQALDLPCKIRKGWDEFENNKEIEEIIQASKTCYRGTQ